MGILGIELAIDANGAIESGRLVSGVLDGVQKSARRADRALRKHAVATRDVNQGYMNMVTGLQFISMQARRTTAAMVGFFTSTSDAAAELEVAMARVSIVMGRIGANEDNDKLILQYADISDKVLQIGRDTEFTATQAAEAFTMLKSAGLETVDTLKVIESVMAFSSASAGTVSLADAADMASLSVTALGGAVEDINTTMDMLVKTQSISKIKMHEFIRVFRSMGPTAALFKNTARETFLAVIGQMRQMGRTAAQVGIDMQALRRSFAQLFIQVKKGHGDRLEGMKALGIDPKSLLDAKGNFKDLATIIELFQAAMIKAKKQGGTAAMLASLRMALGARNSANVMLQTMGYQEKYGKSVREMAVDIKDSMGMASAAQEKFLGTMQGKLMILAGSWKLLKVEIGRAINGIAKPIVTAITKIINLVVSWSKQNPVLSRTVLALTSTLIGLLGVIAVGLGILALAHLGLMAIGATAAEVAGEMTAASVANMIYANTLAPLVALASPVVSMLATLAAAAGAVALAYETNLGGFADFIDKWVNDIKTGVRFAIAILSEEPPPVFKQFSRTAYNIGAALIHLYRLGKQFVDGALIPLKAGFYAVKWVVSAVIRVALYLVDVVGRLFGAFTSGIGGIVEATDIMKALGFAIGAFVTVGIMGNLVTMAWTRTIGLWQAVVRVASAVSTMWANRSKAATLATLGWKAAVHGLKLAFLAIPKGAWLAAGATKAWTMALKLGRAVLVGFRAMINLTRKSTIAFAIAQKAIVVATKAWAVVTGILNAVLALNPVVLIIAALITLVATIVWMIEHWDQVRAAFLEGAAAIGRYLRKVWQSVKGFFLGIWDVVSSVAEELYQAGVNIINKLWEGMKDAWKSVSSWFLDKVQWIVDLWPFSPAKHGPLRSKPPERAGRNVVNYIADGAEQAVPRLNTVFENVVSTVPTELQAPSIAPAIDPLSSELSVTPSFIPSTNSEPVKVEVTNTATESTSNNYIYGQNSGKKETSVVNNVRVDMKPVFNLKVDQLSESEAGNFAHWLAKLIREQLHDELERRSLA